MRRCEGTWHERLSTVVVAFLLLAGGARAQVTPEAPLTREEVIALREVVSGTESLDETEKRLLVERCSTALAKLDVAAGHLADAAHYDQLTREAPALTASLEAELARTPQPVRPEVPEGATVAALEDLQSQAAAELKAAREKVNELENEATLRTKRRPEIITELAAVRIEVQERAEALAAGTAGESLEARVRQVELRAELDVLRAQARALEAEQRSYDERSNLLPKRRQRAQRRVSELEVVVDVWSRAVATARDEANRQAREEAQKLAREEAAQHPRIQEIIQETQELLSREQGESGLATSLEGCQERLREREKELARVESAYDSARKKLSRAGLSDAMGRILREQLDGLLRPGELAAETRAVKKELGEVSFASIEVSERRLHVADVEVRRAELERELEDQGVTVDEAFRDAIQSALTQRAEAVRRVDELLRAYEHQLESLLEAQRRLEEVSAEFREFLQENVLFVRSIEGAKLPRLADARDALVWLVANGDATPDGRTVSARRKGPRWDEVPGLVGRVSAATVAGAIGMLLLLLLLVLGHRPMAAALGEVGKEARRFRTDSFRLTVKAGLLTVGHALPIPLALWVLGWILDWAEVRPAGTGDVGQALQSLGWLLLPFTLTRSVMYSGGLADVHFRWPSAVLKAFRRELRWFVPVFWFGCGLAIVFRGHAVERFESSLGRLGFLIGALGLAVFFWRVTRRGGQSLGSVLARDTGLIGRTRRVWGLIIELFPLALVVASASGFHYTALRFADTYLATLAWVLVLILVRALMSRWQFIARRRLAVEQARAKARARSEATGAEVGAGEGGVVIDEEHVDIPAVDAQTRRLFNGLTAIAFLAGVYLIWASVLPALGALERVELWPDLRIVDEAEVLEEPAPAGDARSADAGESAKGSSAHPFFPSPGKGLDGGESSPAGRVTLAAAIIAVLLLIVTTLMAQNIPGLLEIGLLQRLPLDAGARYAFTSILRYAILIVGISAGLGTIGIRWSTVQWLAAALTFGLAFGLQEIFANFVSGLILLLERPLRVGDVVVIGDIQGMVSRIRMRATTITDWDRRELLVPNKQFITDKMVNLTLTDSVTRVVIPVGVAYGSDVRKASKLMLEVAARTSGVVDDPEPSVVFREFGASALILQLRIFIPNFDVWPEVMTDVHLGIDDVFREAGIEISFPQRDLHLRSIDDDAGEALRAARRRSTE